MSSDGNGARPKEAKGENKLRVANYMPLSALHGMWRQLAREEGIALDTALSTVTSNPARAAGLASKGVIRAANDADLLILGDDLSIDATIARGRVFLKHGKPVARGMFDQTIMDQLA
jgi:beta-aspartyl-dipeptidase (metallo-type)